MITAVNKHTGEIVELEADTYEKLVQAWQIASEYEKVSKALKDQLKELVPSYISDKGTSPEYNGVMFRQSSIQRMNYDKTVLQEVIDDQGLLFEMLKPNKTFIDKYLKENLAELGDISTTLRKSMQPDGAPYTVIKLEKLTRG